MTRRGFIASISAFILTIQTVKSKALGYGFLDVNRHVALRHKGICLKVLLNGEDVTARCFEADDQLGYVGLYRHRNGRPYLDFSSSGEAQAAKEFLHGRVEFVQQ